MAEGKAQRGKQGRGTKRERSPGVWQLRVYDKATGKQIAESFKGGERDANRALAQLVAKVAAGEVEVKDGRPRVGRAKTVEDWLDEWLAYERDQGKQPTTIRGYESCVERLKKSDLAEIPLAKLSAEDLSRAYRSWKTQGPSGRPLSTTTIRHTHRVLALALNLAVDWGRLPKAVTDRVKPPRGETKRPTAPEPSEVRKLVTEAEEDYPVLALAVRLAAATGLRRGELCALKWGDLDTETGVLRVRGALRHGYDKKELKLGSTKTKAGARSISLDAGTLTHLEGHRANVIKWAKAAGVEVDFQNGYLLPGQRRDDPERAWSGSGAPIDPSCRYAYRPDTLTAQFRALAKKAGVTTRFHDLRHFTATQLIGAGMDIVSVAQALGHAQPTTTLNIYAAVIPEKVAATGAILGAVLAEPETLAS